MKFEIYPTQAELEADGLFQVTGTLRWKKEIRWGEREVNRMEREGVDARMGVLTETTNGNPTYAIFRDRSCEKRYKAHGENLI